MLALCCNNFPPAIDVPAATYRATTNVAHSVFVVTLARLQDSEYKYRERTVMSVLG